MALKAQSVLTKEIATIGRAGIKLTKMIQDAAVQAIGYSLVHGDVTIGQRLFEACPKGVRRNSLVAFLEKFGAFRWDAKNKRLAHRKSDVEFTEAYEQDLMATPWDDAKPEPEIVSVFDVTKEFDKFIKRMEKLRQDADITLHHKALLDQLQETSSQYNARLVLGEAADKAVL